MSEERFELPPGWVLANLGCLAELVGGGTPERKRAEFYDGGIIPWATPTDIQPERILTVRETSTRITELGLRKSSARVLPVGTVLFSSRASIGKIGIAAIPMATNQGFANLIPFECVDSRYLAYCLRRFTKEIRALASGTTYLEVSKSALREFAVPVAPLPEQRRIVTKIEGLLEESRTAGEALDRVPSLLKKFRQSVLAAAFRGDLTRAWREQNPGVEHAFVVLERIRAERRRSWEEDLRTKGKDPKKAKYEGPEPVDTSDLPELPGGWLWTNVDSLISDARYGTSQKCSATPNGVAVLRIPNVVRGLIDLRDLKFAEMNPSELDRLLVRPGDLLVVRTNGSLDLVGKAALVAELPQQCAFASYLIRLRPVSGSTLARYINLVFASKLAREPVEAKARSTAGQFNVNLETLRSICLPLPSAAEMEVLVDSAASLLGQANLIERPILAARQRADRIDQSVLARAFRGELVPQDPDDEPASTRLNHTHDGVEHGSPGKR